LQPDATIYGLISGHKRGRNLPLFGRSNFKNYYSYV